MGQRLVVGLCGSHATGKSTIMRTLAERGFDVDTSPSLSRSAQAMLGWDNLHRAQESHDNMWRLQNAILAAMRERDQRINNSGKTLLVDRTPADVWGYVQMWVGRLDSSSMDWSKYLTYKRDCLELASQYHRQLFVPIRNEIAFVEEPGRADLVSREFHSKAVEMFLSQSGFPYSIIKTLSPNDRADEAAYWL